MDQVAYHQNAVFLKHRMAGGMGRLNVRQRPQPMWQSYRLFSFRHSSRVSCYLILVWMSRNVVTLSPCHRLYNVRGWRAHATPIILYIGAQERRRCAAAARHRVAQQKKREWEDGEEVGGEGRGEKRVKTHAAVVTPSGLGSSPLFYPPLNAWSTTSVARREGRTTNCTNLTKKGTPVSDFRKDSR